MIPSYYPHFRPQTSSYLPSSPTSVSTAVRFQSPSQTPASKTSIPKMVASPLALSNISPQFFLQTSQNSSSIAGEQFVKNSRIDTQTSISDVVASNATVLLNIRPQIGFSGSLIQKPSEKIIQKHVKFQKGLQQLISVREHLRETKIAIAYLIPIIKKQALKITDAIEIQFKKGIPDRSKILYDLYYERQYHIIAKSLEQYQLEATSCLDTMRKRNNLKKQDFQSIFNIANNSATYVKNLISEFPTTGWNSPQNKVDYKALVLIAKKQLDIIQTLKVLENNISNKNYSYRQNAPTDMTESITRPINITMKADVSEQLAQSSRMMERPATPRFI